MYEKQKSENYPSGYSVSCHFGDGSFHIGWLIEKITGFPISSHESYYIGLGVIYSFCIVLIIVIKLYQKIKYKGTVGNTHSIHTTEIYCLTK